MSRGHDDKWSRNAIGGTGKLTVSQSSSDDSLVHLNSPRNDLRGRWRLVRRDGFVMLHRVGEKFRRARKSSLLQTRIPLPSEI